MSPRVKTAYAGPDWVPLPAHPAPNANGWGTGISNTARFTATSAGAVIYTPNPSASLLQIRVDKDCLMLVNGGANISATGFPLSATGYFSYSVPAGSPISFQAVSDDVAVTVLEG